MCERGPNVYAITREFWGDPDFPDVSRVPFTDREAWLWLIGAAAWKDLRTRGSAGPVNLKRGELSFSVRFLAEKWGWSKSAVARFFAKLEKRDTLRDTSRDGNKVYFIRNYNRFQIVGAPKRDDDRDASRDATGTDAGHERDKEETGETGEYNNISSLRSDIRPAAQAPAEPATPSQPNLPAEPNAAERNLSYDAESKTLEAYNAVAAETGWPLARHVTANRRKQIRARLREAGGIEGWRTAMELARASTFLRGDRGRSAGHENWTPDFDFFLKQKTFTKLMEGGYGDNNGTGNHPDGSGNGAGCEPPARSAARRVIAQMYGGGEVQFPV